MLNDSIYAHDETLITKKFYVEHAIGFRNIERSSTIYRKRSSTTYRKMIL